MKLEAGKKYDVIVIRAIKSGIIVRLKDDGSTELIHVSNISDRFVKNVEDFVTIGEEYTAECIDGYDGRLQLSLKHLNLKNSRKSNIRTEDINVIPAPPRKQYHRTTNRSGKFHMKPVADSTSNLDDMIAACDKVLKDKLSGQRSYSKRRR